MELFVAVVIVWGGCVDALAMHESVDEEDDEEDEDEDDDDEGTVDESESPSSSLLTFGDDPLHTPLCTLFQSLDFFSVVVADLICGAFIGLAVSSSGEYDDDVVVVRSVVVGEEVAAE